MPRELAACVERANLDPEVHVIALAGNGSGFCGGYDLVGFGRGAKDRRGSTAAAGAAEDAAGLDGSPLDPAVQAANHDPDGVWDPVIDFQMMSRNVRGFMSLFHSEKPVLCKVHGFCVAGGTDMALCSDLLVIEDEAKIGYPPARVWGVPTTALWAHRIGLEQAKRLLFTGDCISGTEAVEWGLATEAAPAERLDERFEALLERVARVPVNQLVMHKLLVNQTLYAQGLHATPAPRHLLRRHRPPHAGGLRVPAPGRGGGLGRGGPRARRAVRRSRPLDVQGLARDRSRRPDTLRRRARAESRDHRRGAARPDRGQPPRRPRGRAARDRPTSARRGRIVVDERHLHPGGLVHGGAWVALADTSPPGRPSATCRRATTSPRWR